MPDVTVKLSDGVREVTVEVSGVDDDLLACAEDTALRLYKTAAATPPDRRAGFANWALSSDTERSLEE